MVQDGLQEAFGLDFGASWASNLDPSSLKIVDLVKRTSPLSDFKLDVFKNGVLEGSGLDLGGPRTPF